MSRDFKERPLEELQAGDAFRNALLEKADDWRGPAPLWHGWAIMDAFLAGIDYARQSGDRTDGTKTETVA